MSDEFFFGLFFHQLYHETWLFGRFSKHQWPGRLALLAVFLFWIPIVVAISGWTTLSSIQGTVPAVKKFVEAHPTIGSCAVDGRPQEVLSVWNRHVGPFFGLSKYSKWL